MPLFEFACRACGCSFEELMSHAQMQAGQVLCPDCGSRKIARNLSAFSTSSNAGAGLAPCDGSGRACGGRFT